MSVNILKGVNKLFVGFHAINIITRDLIPTKICVDVDSLLTAGVSANTVYVAKASCLGCTFRAGNGDL